MTNISDQIELLGREAELASKTVGSGLTEIRNYSFGGFGYFYSGLFSISIGLERILKLILLIDFYNSNGQTFPANNSYLRNLSHDLNKLMLEVRKVNSRISTPISDGIFQDQITINVLDILSDFARYHRYYNLDMLQGGSYTENEPLARWEDSVNREILARHFKMTENLKKLHAACLSMQPAIVHFIKEDGGEITDINEYADYSVRVECKQKYSFFYCYRLVRYVSEVFRSIEQFQLSPLFGIYCMDDSYAKGRKTWNPYKP